MSAKEERKKLFEGLEKFWKYHKPRQPILMTILCCCGIGSLTLLIWDKWILGIAGFVIFGFIIQTVIKPSGEK